MDGPPGRRLRRRHARRRRAAGRPGDGLPGRHPDGPGTVTWHGLGHLAAGGIGFLCIIAATYVLARHLPRGLALYSRVSGTLFLAGFAGIASGNQAPWLTLGFVAAVVVIFAWLAAVSIRLYRTLPACGVGAVV